MIELDVETYPTVTKEDAHMKRVEWVLILTALVIAFSIAIAGDLIEVKNLKAKSGKPYKVAEKSLDVGDVYYIDRQYTIVSMPDELKGGTWIMTANDDKHSKGEDFLTFEVTQSVTVYILHDSRGEEEKGGTPPEWLSKNFEKVEDWKVEVTDASMGWFNVWKADFPKGEIKIGGNEDPPAAGHGSNYVVVLSPSRGAPVESHGKLPTTWGEIKAR